MKKMKILGKLFKSKEEKVNPVEMPFENENEILMGYCKKFEKILEDDGFKGFSVWITGDITLYTMPEIVVEEYTFKTKG